MLKVNMFALVIVGLAAVQGTFLTQKLSNTLAQSDPSYTTTPILAESSQQEENYAPKGVLFGEIDEEGDNEEGEGEEEWRENLPKLPEDGLYPLDLTLRPLSSSG